MLNHFLTYFVLLIGIFCSDVASALTQAPVLLRACLNTNDSTITIEYKNFPDACGSFVRYEIYGKETGPTFSYLEKQESFSATSIKIKLPNTNSTWQFYFDALYLCNGTDTIQSNVILVDSSKPPLSEIDSVSVDFSSQKLTIGWSNNSAPDVKGYRIYQNSSGINSTLGESSTLSYILSTHSASQPISLTLAAYDSCNLFSPISNIHRSIILSGSYDVCTKMYTLTWSPYVGWATENHVVHASINDGPYLVLNNTVTANSFKLNLKSGDSVCVYVQAKKTGSNTSSSSNKVCHKVQPFILPSELYLSVASIPSADRVDLQVYTDNRGTTDSVIIYHVNGTTLTPIKRAQISLGVQNTDAFHFIKTDIGPHQYIAKTFAPCFGESAQSNIAQTVFLQINQESKLLNWSSYFDWKGDVEYYEVQGTDGSTWNTLSNIIDNSYPTNEIYTCYRIVAHEKNNTLGFSKTSMSNEVCINKEPTFFVPNALNSAGSNNTFRVVGTSLDYDKSEFFIFDRWGGTMFKSNRIDVGWNLSTEGQDVPMGVYFYVLSITDLSGNKHKSSGSFRIIK